MENGLMAMGGLFCIAIFFALVWSWSRRKHPGQTSLRTPLSEAQRLGMRQGHFQLARTALLYGMTEKTDE
jgi:hypothetical protein